MTSEAGEGRRTGPSPRRLPPSRYVGRVGGRVGGQADAASRTAGGFRHGWMGGRTGFFTTDYRWQG
jgi:hypothetical protein